MYREYYNLIEKPFEITTDPRFLWIGEQHREALATLEYGIQEEKGFLLLTGDVGSGKTVLINALISTMNLPSFISAIPDPGLDLIDFYNALADSLDMNQRFTSKGEFLARLKQFLYKADSIERRVLLIIDEAQRLNHELLEEIRLLSNIELENRKLINIFFVGQPEINDLLLHPRGKAVLNRIAVRYHIEPLAEKDNEEYIRHRLKIAGSTREIFTAEAMRKIYEFSDGNPRLTNIICDRALLTGYAEEQAVITDDIIEECIQELRIPGEQPEEKEDLRSAETFSRAADQPHRRSFSLVASFLVVCCTLLALGAGYYLLYRHGAGPGRWSMDPIAPRQPDIQPQQIGKTTTETPATTTPGPLPAGEPPPAAPSETAVAETPESPLTSGPVPPPPALNQPPHLADPVALEKIVIYFQPNSNELTEQEYRILDRFAAVLKQRSAVDVAVNGYTDSAGELGYNLTVSRLQANLIKSYLVAKGIRANRITAVGMGPRDPIASNETEKGRSLNRRVEIELLAE